MSEDPFKKILNPEQYRVMRQGAGERAFSGRFWDNDKSGTYLCAACKKPLFKSSEKFDNGSGWPSFRKPIDESDIEYRKIPDIQGQLGIRCKRCHSSVGYVIGGENPHYRLNSIALDFEESNHAAVIQDVKDTAGEVKDKAEEYRDGKEESSAEKRAPYSLSGLGMLFGGSAIGLIAGAAGAYFYCQAVCAAPVAPITETATTTATSTPSDAETEPVEAPVTPLTSTTITPRATSTPSPVATTSNSAADNGIATTTQ